MCSTLVVFANELVLISRSDKQAHYYYSHYYAQDIFLLPIVVKHLLHLIFLIVTLMNRSKVLQVLSLHWQSLTSIDYC